MMRTEEVAQAVLRAVQDGDLIFVPEWDALRACVKAIQEDRQKRPAPAAQQHDRNPYATVQQMMGKPPRMPSGLNTPLADAQPFNYQPDDLSDDVTDIAARGVSAAEDAECFAQYERDLDLCEALGGPMGGARGIALCKQNAFDNFQQFRGY